MPFGPAVAVGKRNLVRSARRNPSTTVARRFGEARIAIRAGNDADRHTIAMRQREFGGGVVARRQSTDPVGTTFANQTLPSGPSVTMFRGRDAALADNEPSGWRQSSFGYTAQRLSSREFERSRAKKRIETRFSRRSSNAFVPFTPRNVLMGAPGMGVCRGSWCVRPRWSRRGAACGRCRGVENWFSDPDEVTTIVPEAIRRHKKIGWRSHRLSIELKRFHVMVSCSFARLSFATLPRKRDACRRN